MVCGTVKFDVVGEGEGSAVFLVTRFDVVVEDPSLEGGGEDVRGPGGGVRRKRIGGFSVQGKHCGKGSELGMGFWGTVERIEGGTKWNVNGFLVFLFI